MTTLVAQALTILKASKKLKPMSSSDVADKMLCKNRDNVFATLGSLYKKGLLNRVKKNGSYHYWNAKAGAAKRKKSMRYGSGSSARKTKLTASARLAFFSIDDILAELKKRTGE